MALRTFTDAEGTEWQVWDNIPDRLVSNTLEGGWLTFQSPTEKRRLAPIPLYWVTADEEELARLLATARPVRERWVEQREDEGDEAR